MAKSSEMRKQERRWSKEQRHLSWLFWQLKKPSVRKIQLYACASARHVWDLLPDDCCRRAIELLERVADGLAEASEIVPIRKQVSNLIRRRLERERQIVEDDFGQEEDWDEEAEVEITPAQAAEYARQRREAAVPEMRYFAANAVSHALCKPTTERALYAAGCVVSALGQRVIAAGKNPARTEGKETRWTCDLVREVFPNPFRPVVLDPSWRTAEVLSLARGIYEGRAFDGMPMLADALMEAGCASEDILDHCRQKEEHARGCWVVDLLLGKS